MDRLATFDALTTTGPGAIEPGEVDLSDYSEGMLSITVSDTAWAGFNAFGEGFATEFYYGDAGNNDLLLKLARVHAALGDTQDALRTYDRLRERVPVEDSELLDLIERERERLLEAPEPADGRAEVDDLARDTPTGAERRSGSP